MAMPWRFLKPVLARRFRRLTYPFASQWARALSAGALPSGGLAGAAEECNHGETEAPRRTEGWAKKTGGVDARPLLQAIRRSAREGHWLSVLSLVREAKEKRLSRNLITYNAAISALAKLDRPQEAQEVLALMEGDGFRPDVVTYTSCIDACAREGDIETARHFFKAIEDDKDFQADIKAFSAYINVCAKAGDKAEALATLREKMPAAMVVPNAFTYNSCIDACAQDGDVKTARQLLKDMKDEHGLKPGTRAFSAYINVCAKAGNKAEALATLREKMPAAKVVPNVVSYTSCIDACAQDGDARTAQQLLNAMKDHDLKPNVRTFSAYVNVCAKAGDKTEALATLKKNMPAAKMVPDVITYTSCIDACAQEGDIKTAQQLLKEMKDDRGLAPELKTFNAFINVCAKAGDKAEALATLREKMPAAMVVPNVITYTSCINACVRDGDIVASLQLLKEMHAKGLEPTAETYSACISACKAGSHWEAALIIHRRAFLHLGAGAQGICSAVFEVLDAAGRLADVDVEYERLVHGKYVKLWEGVDKMDLHDHSKSMARAALRHVLRNLPGWLSKHPKAQALTIVTGHGEKRAQEGAGQLKAAVKQFLTASEPPLKPLDAPWNAGMIVLRRADLEAYSGARSGS